jgi:hypothetical protein
MSTFEQVPTEADGLEIFNDVHDVPDEAVAHTVLHVVIAVLGYTLMLGLVVVALVKAIEVFWPVLLFIVVPWVMNLIFTFG